MNKIRSTPNTMANQNDAFKKEEINAITFDAKESA